MCDPSSTGYDRLAKHYQFLETLMFGTGLQRSRTALLESIPACQNALLLGDGDGRLLESFLSSQPECQITSIDQSPGMLERQQLRLAHHPQRSNVSWLQQDARHLSDDNSKFDLLIAAFFLDCLTPQELEQHLPHWLAKVVPGGWFYFVDFRLPDPGWKRVRGRCYLAMMHWFFRWQTDLPNRNLINLESVLDRYPIELVASRYRNHDLISSRLYRLPPMEPAPDCAVSKMDLAATNDPGRLGS